jgi:glycosyltransferase involved in cell wall biosynthesis
MNSALPLLSIVVIGRNEGQRLARCLDSLLGVEKDLHGLSGGVEVVYADSGSSDGSPELARERGAEVVAIESARPTAALGRNAGWRKARAPFVLFLDGDTVLHPDFAVAALAEMEQDARLAVVCGNRREIRPGDSIFNRVLDLDWIYPPGYTEFCGGDALMRRAALEEVDGYDETLIAGEEPEMCRRMRARGWKILHIDQPMTGHDLAMTRWSQYWKRATRAGYAYSEVSARFRQSGDPFWAADRRANLVRGSFWLGGSLLAVLASAALLRWEPLAVWILFVLLMGARSSWKARWKSRDWATLWLCGLHSHLQQVPILVGQFQHWRDRRAGRGRGLIEYKEASK